MELKEGDTIVVNPFEEREIIQEVGKGDEFATNYSTGIIITDIGEKSEFFLAMLRRTAYKILVEKRFKRVSVCSIKLGDTEALVFLVTGRHFSDERERKKAMSLVKKARDKLWARLRWEILEIKELLMGPERIEIEEKIEDFLKMKEIKSLERKEQ